jgi:predicted transposase YbfD/YdcC
VGWLPIRRLSPPEHETVDRGHGRIEVRQIWTTTELNGYLDFPHVNQAFLIKRITTDLTGEVVKGRRGIEEVCVGITSLSAEDAGPERVLALNRGQWTIENRSHHVRDMTYDEDRSQVRKGNRPQALASFRNLAISLLRLANVTNVAAATRHLNRRPKKVLALLGA